MPCQIIISQGKNKGLQCGQVNKQCRHNNNVCYKCGKTLITDTSLIQHRKICNLGLKIKPVITRKDKLPILEIDSNVEVLERKVEALEQKLKTVDELEQKLKTVTDNKRPITIKNTVNINIAAIDGTNALKTLMENLGQSEAMEFLLGLTTSKGNQLLPIIEKLYLTGDPLNYPIANKDGKSFRFLDTNHQLIHDVNGKKITDLSTKIHRNIYAGAANLEAQRVMDNDNNQSYNSYYTLQECASSNSNIKCDTKTFVRDLAHKTYNPEHVFFVSGVSVILDD